jgi:hypothetical protein
MSRRYFAALVVVGLSAASIPGGTMAAADPVWPYAGAESAADTIRDLEDQGYTVAINWVAGDHTVALSRCSVVAIHNPDRSPDAVPMTSTTVYVDVSCPSDHNWDWGVGVGIGF